MRRQSNVFEEGKSSVKLSEMAVLQFWKCQCDLSGCCDIQKMSNLTERPSKNNWKINMSLTFNQFLNNLNQRALRAGKKVGKMVKKKLFWGIYRKRIIGHQNRYWQYTFLQTLDMLKLYVVRLGTKTTYCILDSLLEKITYCFFK